MPGMLGSSRIDEVLVELSRVFAVHLPDVRAWVHSNKVHV